jgi:predicted phosphohydrolase
MVIPRSVSFEYERIVYWSDLHLDYSYSRRQIEVKVKKDYRWHTFDIPQNPEHKKTILLIGGDTVNGNHIHLLPRFIDEVLKSYGMVVMIPGNHEYYYAKYEDINTYLRSIEIPNFHLLINEAIEVVHPTRFANNRIVIYGSTLWSDLKDVREEKRIQEIFLRDQARMSGGYLSLTEYEALYTESVTLMRKFLKKFDRFDDPHTKVIILTHYALTEDFVAEKYKGDPDNPLFHSNLQPVFYYPIYAAICGHVHQRFDFVKNGVICLTNPRGYPSENTLFNVEQTLPI